MPIANPIVLVLDDEPSIQHTLGTALRLKGFQSWPAVSVN